MPVVVIVMMMVVMLMPFMVLTIIVAARRTTERSSDPESNKSNKCVLHISVVSMTSFQSAPKNLLMILIEIPTNQARKAGVRRLADEAYLETTVNPWRKVWETLIKAGDTCQWQACFGLFKSGSGWDQGSIAGEMKLCCWVKPAMICQTTHATGVRYVQDEDICK